MANENSTDIVKFGKAGLAGNTPTPLKWIYRGLGLALTIWLAIISYYPNIPVHIQLEVVKALGAGSTISYIIIQFFGFSKTDKDNGSTTN